MKCCCAGEPETSQIVELSAEKTPAETSTGDGDVDDEPPVQIMPSVAGDGPAEFTVTLEKTPGSILGLELDLMDDVNAQVCGIDAGLIQSYNETAKSKEKVRVGDFIAKVNGTSGDAKVILEMLKSEGTINILIKRPEETILTIDKGEGVIGLELQKAPRGYSLLIHEVKEGAIQQWNVANPSYALKPRDRIVCVNGNKDSTTSMMTAIQYAQKKLVLHIVRPPC